MIALAVGLPFNTEASTLSGQDLLSNQTVEVKPGAKGTVLLFMSAKCPCSNSHVNIVKKLATDFKDFSFVVVHSNSDESAETSRTYFKTIGFPFAVLQDDKAKLANEYKAFKTPHAFVVSPDGKILYKGGVTNSIDGEAADKHFLREALTDLEAGHAVQMAATRTVGCAISR